MKWEYKILLTFICFLLFTSIYVLSRTNEGGGAVLQVTNGSDVDIRIRNMLVQNRTAKSEAFDVILSAYKHSGSSVTGRILSSRQDAFYIYEPLWKVLRFSFYKGPDLRCFDAHKYCLNLTRELSDTRDYIGGEQIKASHLGGDLIRIKHNKGINRMLNESLGFLQSIFQCSFHHYSQYFEDPKTNKLLEGNHPMIFFKGKNWSSFRSCITRNAESYKDCWKEAESICRAAKHRVIKLLRMSIDNLASLLQANSRLKVIYLYRDPRGIHNSQSGDLRNISKNDGKFDNVRQHVESLCERMQWDITAGKELKEMFPERVKFIQYENLGNLTDIGRDLYAFLGMPYTSEHQKMLINLMNPKGNKGFHPFNYRTRLSWDIVSLFETECAGVLDQLGYTRYKSEAHLRDMSQSGFVQKNTLSLPMYV